MMNRSMGKLRSIQTIGKFHIEKAYASDHGKYQRDRINLIGRGVVDDPPKEKRGRHVKRKWHEARPQ